MKRHHDGPAWLAACCLLAAVQTPASADYPRPEGTGFHNCVIIYDKPVRGTRDLAPYVARTPIRGQTEWLFDAFLFCMFNAPSGARTDSGPTRKADWTYQLDRWFAPGRDAQALDSAIASAAALSPAPPSRRTVVLTIPFPNPAVHDFGDVDGDGRSEDLSTDQGRQAVLRWYVAEAERRFAACRFRHLSLWGFYWMAEQAPPGEASLIRAAADVVHAAGRRFLWIPWFAAPGWDRWREMGFDAAILQPNYAFQTWTHQGRVRRNRLAVAADMARRAGMGVEIEAGAVLTAAADRQPFLRYLRDGADDRLGYQRGASAYYLSASTVEDACYAADAASRVLYDRLADYVAGSRVADDDAPRILGARAHRGALTLRAVLPRQLPVAEVDLLLEEPATARPWVGDVEARVRTAAGAPWVPGGWALRAGRAQQDGDHQVLTVPVDSRATELELSLRAAAGYAAPRAPSLRVDIVQGDGTERHLATGRPYTFIPPPPQAYGDTGGMLTDGRVSANGWGQGQTVGWSGVNHRASVCIDLGRPVPIDSVEICCVGGGAGAVEFPSQALVMLGRDRPAPGAGRGTGPKPGGLVWATGGPLQVDRRRAPDDLDGHVTASFRGAPRARYVTVSLVGGFWTMLSEIRVLSSGTDAALGAPYTLQPAPSPVVYDPDRGGSDDTRYPDDGARLTDGVIARSFIPGQVTGWHDGRERFVLVDLGGIQSVSEVIVWSLRGGAAAIYAPESMAFEMSEDGVAWRAAGVVRTPPGPQEDRQSCTDAPYRLALKPGSRARFIRVTVRPGAGWTMLSEIEVR